MKFRKTLMAVTLGAALVLTGCSTKDTAKTTVQSQKEVEQKTEFEKPASIEAAMIEMNGIVKELLGQLDNKEDDKISKSGENLSNYWKVFEEGFEDEIKDNYLDLYVKIEEPLEIIEAGAKVKPVDITVLSTEASKLGEALTELQNSEATTSGINNMRETLKTMTQQLADNKTKEAITTSEALEENWEKFEDGIKKDHLEAYEKIEGPLGLIQGAVKVEPLDTKVLGKGIQDLDKELAELQESIAFVTGPQNMKIALKKIEKNMNPLNEEKLLQYGERLEKYWASFEEVVEEKNPDLYEKAEGPLGIIQAGIKVKPIDEKTIKEAISKLTTVVTDIQNIK